MNSLVCDLLHLFYYEFLWSALPQGNSLLFWSYYILVFSNGTFTREAPKGRESTISRDDLVTFLEERELNEITDEDMSWIAKRISDNIMDIYWDTVQYCVEQLKENQPERFRMEVLV